VVTAAIIEQWGHETLKRNTISALMVATGLAPGCAYGAETVDLVKDGKPLFAFIYPTDSERAGERVYSHNQPKSGEVLARILADYVEKSVGERPLTVHDGAQRKEGLAIHCGMTAYVRGLGLPLDDFDSDEFIIAFPDRNNIVIAGKCQDGIEWGTYEFLERYFGVRWLYEGELGEHVPSHENLTVPMQQVQEKPAFLSRALAIDNRRKELKQWLRFHRIRRRIKFHHYVGELFHPRKYWDTHPEFYPELNGDRVKPAGLIAWQPCFTAPGIVQEAADRIIDYFTKNPDTSIYSLGVNDNEGHCECETCLETDGDTKNSIGRRDRSRSYYRFCSEVAELVSAALPKRQLKFGLIAYTSVRDFPEGETIHPNILPYLTTDAMRWLDCGIAAHEHAQLRMWKNAAGEIGIYDYIYGGLYELPRIYFHHMADYLRTFQTLGVKHYYGEAHFRRKYVEGPKYYLAMKLLWAPNRSPDQLLQEWYECAVGPRAAPDVAAFFGLWEDLWTRRIPKGEWFNAHKKTTMLKYLNFRNY